MTRTSSAATTRTSGAATNKVAVIGGGVGGLTAAGLLAKRGRHVVLFEQHEVLGGKAGTVQHDGLTFDTGPTLLALPHFVQSVFADLGAPMPRLERLATQCHYVYPDGRAFDVCDDPERTIESAMPFGDLRPFYAVAKQVYQHMGEPFLSQPLESFTGFMRSVLKQGPKAALFGMRMGTLDGLARSTTSSRQLQQFIGRFATYVGGSPYKASAAYAMIAHVEQAFGVHYPEGGMGALARALAEAVIAQGVEVRLNTRAQWAPATRGFTVNGEPFAQVIVNSDPTPPGHELSLSGYVIMVRAKTDLPHHTILFAPDAEQEFGALFRGELPRETTIYLHRPAGDAVYVMINTPPKDFETGPVRERVLKAAGLSDAEVIAERTPSDFARTGSPQGALYGAVGHGRLGPFRRPRMRGKYRGQYFTGGGTHPGGGVPMVALSGRFAAEMAMREAVS